MVNIVKNFSQVHLHTRASAHLHTQFFLSQFIYCFILTYPFMYTSPHPHIHIYTRTPPPPPLIFTLGLLFHSDFSYQTRLCPLYEPGVLGHSLPTGLVIQPQLGLPRLGLFFTIRVLDNLWRLITSEIKPTEQNGAESRTPS